MTEAADDADLMKDGLDTVADVARFLKLSLSTVYLLMQNGTLPFVKLGKSRRVPHRAVLQLAVRGLVSRGAGNEIA
jgi:excisionase family DNA binding protein